MRKLIICVFFAILMFSIIGCNSHNDELLTWAKNLHVEDITVIEAVAMPSLENQRYKYYDVSEFERIAEIVNGAKGKKVDNPEEINGGTIAFYITTSDGERHRFSNIGNKYLVIDGNSYEASYDWLSGWGDEILDSKVPNDFVY